MPRPLTANTGGSRLAIVWRDLPRGRAGAYASAGAAVHAGPEQQRQPVEHAAGAPKLSLADLVSVSAGSRCSNFFIVRMVL